MGTNVNCSETVSDAILKVSECLYCGFGIKMPQNVNKGLSGESVFLVKDPSETL
jgi:hypothetical protein